MNFFKVNIIKLQGINKNKNLINKSIINKKSRKLNLLNKIKIKANRPSQNVIIINL